MIRTEGWAFVGRTRDHMQIRFDPRCIGLPALKGLLDGIRRLGDGGEVREVEVRYHHADVPTCWTMESMLAACRRILEVYDEAQKLEYANFSLVQNASGRVETQHIGCGSAATRAFLRPRLRTFIERWKDARGLEALIDQLDDTGQYVSIFRMEDGDPRACRLGGGLIFSTPSPEGARLPDILPAPQIEASRDRITTAIASGEPVARRHRSEFYDVIALTLPVRTRSGVLAVTMSQGDLSMPPTIREHHLPPLPIAPEAGLRKQQR